MTGGIAVPESFTAKPTVAATPIAAAAQRSAGVRR
jgi:hypothetical protein